MIVRWSILGPALAGTMTLGAVFGVWFSPLAAGDVPNTFTDGEVASAVDINSNFAAVAGISGLAVHGCYIEQLASSIRFEHTNTTWQTGQCEEWLDTSSPNTKRNGNGDIDIAIKAGVFSQAPACVVSATNGNRICNITALSSATLINDLRCYNSSNTQVDTSLYLLCVGKN